MNDFTHDLHDALERHSHEVDGPPLALDTVRSRARRIRRNRRLAVAGGIAAALVVVIPAGMLAAGNATGHNSPLPPVTTQGSDPTKAPDPEVTSSGVGLPYAQSTTLTMPDGTEVHLPHAYQQVIVAGGEVYGAEPDPYNGYWNVDVIGDNGVTDSFVATSELATDAAGTVVTWGSPRGSLMSRSDGQERTLATDRGDVFPVAVVGGPDCAESADGCTVYYIDSQGEPRAIRSGAGDNPVPGNPLKVTDASVDGLISVQTDSTDTGSCFAVEQASGHQLWRTCDYSLDRFSPDGRYVTGSDSYLDGDSMPYAVVLDARTGDEVARYAPDASGVRQLAWEDDQHLLVVQRGDMGWSVVRLTVGGGTETVLGPVGSTDELTPTYVLGGR